METPNELKDALEFRVVMLERVCVAQAEKIEQLEKAILPIHKGNTLSALLERTCVLAQSYLDKRAPKPVWSTIPVYWNWHERMRKG